MPCDEYLTSGEVCLHTRVAAMGLYGPIYVSLADGKDADSASAPARGDGFPRRDASASRAAGDTEGSRRAMPPAAVAEAQGRDSTDFSRKLGMLQRLQAMHRFPVHWANTNRPLRQRYEVHDRRCPACHAPYSVAPDGRAMLVARVSVVCGLPPLTGGVSLPIPIPIPPARDTTARRLAHL